MIPCIIGIEHILMPVVVNTAVLHHGLGHLALDVSHQIFHVRSHRGLPILVSRPFPVSEAAHALTHLARIRGEGVVGLLA